MNDNFYAEPYDFRPERGASVPAPILDGRTSRDVVFLMSISAAMYYFSQCSMCRLPAFSEKRLLQYGHWKLANLDERSRRLDRSMFFYLGPVGESTSAGLEAYEANIPPLCSEAAGSIVG